MEKTKIALWIKVIFKPSLTRVLYVNFL